MRFDPIRSCLALALLLLRRRLRDEVGEEVVKSDRESLRQRLFVRLASSETSLIRF